MVRRSAPRSSPHVEVSWKSFSGDTWAATQANEFLGVVEERDGVYIANNTVRGTYNTYRTLVEAMETFELRDVGS